MSHSTIAIVGSGIVGTTLAYLFTARGYDVHIFEKGSQYPSTAEIFAAQTNLADMPIRYLGSNLQTVMQSGDRFGANINGDLRQFVGGMATQWEAITLRMRPEDFALRTVYGRGTDWPIDYDFLEPYYQRAEAFIGVSGTNDDNPFAPPRSADFPMPAFDLGHEDERMSEKLREVDIHIHTTPQARTRTAYEDRAGCLNFGACTWCPIGAKYMPDYHLRKALGTELCTLEHNVTVRRVIMDRENRANGLLVQGNGDAAPREHTADLVILAPGAIEAARLLLLSDGSYHPDGLGNNAGHVGNHIGFHQIRGTGIALPEKYFFGRAGFWTAQSEQFASHDNRRDYGGIKLEFPDFGRWAALGEANPAFLSQTADAMRDALLNAQDFSTRFIGFHAEADMTPDKYLRLSATETDKFGDAFPHVHHDLSEFDLRTFEFAESLQARLAEGLEGDIFFHATPENWLTGHHHMGGTRMSEHPAGGVVNRYGQVHDVDNVFVLGCSNFVSTSAINPTLTALALTFLGADYMLEQILE